MTGKYMEEGRLPRRPRSLILAALLTLGTVMGCDSNSGDLRAGSSQEESETSKGAPPAQAPRDKQASENAVQGSVDSEVSEKAADKRREITEEAIAALSQTHKALAALDEEKTTEALAALEQATGKLELILARDPTLALAPTGVSVRVLDLLTTLESIEEVSDEAEDALEDGEVQRARRLLSGLGSEFVVSVTNIPLATYPKAIKRAVPLIDQGKIEEAKVALDTALQTLVITEHVIPLPMIRAEAMLADAERLAEKADRSADENELLASLLENARYQLKMSEALGYGKKKDYEPFYEQLDEIEKKTSEGKFGQGFFDKIKTGISKARKSIFDQQK